VTTQTVQTAGIAAMPRVNLMPPEIAEAARFRRLQLAMGSAVVVAAVLVAGLYVNGRSSVTNAQTQVTAATTQHAALQAKLTGLDSVAQTLADVQGKQALLAQAMGEEIRWSYLLNDLSLTVPSNLWITGITANETATNQGLTATAGTSSTTGLGTVTFTVIGLKHDDIASWLDTLAKTRGLLDPTFASSIESAIGSRSVVDGNTTVNLGPKALSNRYVQKASN
jgi:Tfp pilus assembly protein PilN